MVTINLLPRPKIVSTKSLIFLIMSSIIVIFLHRECHAIISEEQEKIIVLKKEIQAIRTETSNFSPKNDNFTPFQNRKYLELWDLLKKLPATVPLGLYLTELSIAKNRYKLVGHAETASLISEWVTQLNHLNFNVSVKEITQKKEVDDFPVEFSVLVFSPKNPASKRRK